MPKYIVFSLLLLLLAHVLAYFMLLPKVAIGFGCVASLLFLGALRELNLGLSALLFTTHLILELYLPPLAQDLYGISSVPLIICSPWVAFGGEFKLYQGIRPGMLIFMFLASMIVVMFSRDIWLFQLANAGFFLVTLSCLLFIEQNPTSMVDLRYYFLATVWLLIVPSTVMLYFGLKLLFCGWIVYIAYNSIEEDEEEVQHEKRRHAPPEKKPKTQPLSLPKRSPFANKTLVIVSSHATIENDDDVRALQKKILHNLDK